MITVELDKYSEENYYKQPANSPIADSPDNVTHARLYYNTFAGSNYIQGDFVSGSNSTVEFDNTDVDYILFKLFVSTDGTTYTERKSFGGTLGKDCVTSQHLLSVKDVTDWKIPVKKTQGGSDVLVFDTLSNVITGAGITLEANGVDYLYCRGMLCQHNSVQSGKAFYGLTIVDGDTGAVTESISSPQITIADSFSRSLSSKISTGKYVLQFRTRSANNFVPDLAGLFGYKFETITVPITSKRTVTATDIYNDIDGYILCNNTTNDITGIGTSFTTDFTVGDLFYIYDGLKTAQVASITDDTHLTLNTSLGWASNPTSVAVTGTIATTNGSPNIVGTGTAFNNMLVGEQIVSANISGIITAKTDDTHITLDTNATATASGTSYAYRVTSAVRAVNVDHTEYTSENTTELIGYLVLDTKSDEGLGYFQSGKLLIKTYNTSWVLTDNLLELGLTFGFKAYQTL